MNYPHNIPSIAELHPAFAADPNIFNVGALQGIHASKVAGTPIDFQAVQNAENTLELLLGLRSENCIHFLRAGLIHWSEFFPVITDEIIETARNRIHIIRQTRK